VLILDARSAEPFAAGHIRGRGQRAAAEFSDERLAESIGRADRADPDLLQQQFRNDRPPVMLKTGRLALNLSTFTHSTATAIATCASSTT
jgi:hypothetical protein